MGLVYSIHLEKDIVILETKTNFKGTGPRKDFRTFLGGVIEKRMNIFYIR